MVEVTDWLVKWTLRNYFTLVDTSASAQTLSHATAQRQTLQIKCAVSPSHIIIYILQANWSERIPLTTGHWKCFY